MSADPIVYCLEHLTDYRQFERLCSDLMAGSGYAGVDPLGGSSDGGRDALFRSSAAGLTIFAFTVRADWRKKLEHDCNRIQAEQHGPQRVVFVCTASLTADDKDKARALVMSRFGWELDLYDLERIRVLLSSNLRHLVASHPAIFCPPFFPQRAGLSIAKSADTVVIDHVGADHAVATWLARRLSLQGYQTWCFGIAPLAGEQNVDESVRLLVQRRAVRYLPVLSQDAVSNRDFMDRCAAVSGLREDFCLPCWVTPLSAQHLGSRLARIQPARFDSSLAAGLAQVLEHLQTSGITPRHSPEQGAQVALRAYVPEPVTKASPEPVFANVFKVTVPASLLVCDLANPLTQDEHAKLRQEWAYVEASTHQLLAFEPPPRSLKLAGSGKLPEYAWDVIEERRGKRSVNVVKELVRRSAELACLRAGLLWCEQTKTYYFPLRDGRAWTQTYEHVDGRTTKVNLNGERQKGWGDRAETFHYQLAPAFRVGQDAAGAFWLTVRIYVRCTDVQGEPYERKEVGRRRKMVTKTWWNREWLARLLGVVQALQNEGGRIQVGAGTRSVQIDTKPLHWQCPVGLDLQALARMKDFGQEIAEIRGADSEEEAEVEGVQDAAEELGANE